MKLLHLSDLHLGKWLNEYSMLEDQAYILTRILQIAEEEKPDGVLIAGDIYDKSIPPVEAVQLFDDFLCRLTRMKTEVFVISGNHDSAERVSFGARLMASSGVHLAPVYKGNVLPIRLSDDYGPVNLYMLPFVKPVHVRAVTDAEIRTYTDAVREAVHMMSVNEAERNVLMAHQFVTGAVRSESEEVSVGGLDNVDAAVFDPFDYVALGHIHAPQNCGSERIRYCGTPLKYSFSEAKDEKSVTVVELREKGSVTCRTVPLIPKRDLVELRGTYDEVMRKSFYENTSWQEDYTRIILTDEQDIPNAMGKLRTVYHHLMRLEYDNLRTRTNRAVPAAAEAERKTPYQLFSEFYALQNNQPMSDVQSAYVQQLIETIEEDRA